MSHLAEGSGEPLRGAKSRAAFRTISEVASDLNVPQHVLRFWETKFSQLKPLKRGGGRRYYRPEDVALLHHIRSLLYGEGYTIKGVQRVLRQNGARPAPEAAGPRVAPAAESPALTARQRETLERALAELAAARDILRQFES